MIVQIGFYVLSALVFLMIFGLFKYADDPRRLTARYMIAGWVWLIYLVFLSRAGVLEDFGLPPRIPLLLAIPAVVAGILFTGTRSFKSVLERMPLHIPVFLTSFRILVELLIYGAYRNGVFPQRVTFEGLNFDIVVGVSALVVGVLLLNKKFSLKGLLLWNVASLLVLAFTVYSFVSSYYFGDYVDSAMKMEFVHFPYLLLASVLLPMAVFLHVISIRQVLLSWQMRVTNRI